MRSIYFYKIFEAESSLLLIFFAPAIVLLSAYVLIFITTKIVNFMVRKAMNKK